MPVLSTFFGIIVRMYRERGGKHTCRIYMLNIPAMR